MQVFAILDRPKRTMGQRESECLVPGKDLALKTAGWVRARRRSNGISNRKKYAIYEVQYSIYNIQYTIHTTQSYTIFNRQYPKHNTQPNITTRANNYFQLVII